MIYMISSELHGKKIEMEMNGQMQHSVKSEMSNWTKQYSYQLTAEQIQAVENNDCSKFKTTFGGKETMSQIWKEQPFGGDCFGQKYAESYDEASWFRARCAFLQYRNYELEDKMEKMRSIAIQLGDDGFCMRCGRWDGTETWEGKGVCKSKTIDGVVVCQECDAEMNEDDEDCESEASGGEYECRNCGEHTAWSYIFEGGDCYEYCDTCRDEMEEKKQIVKLRLIDGDMCAPQYRFVEEEEEEDELNSAIDASGNALY
jgi:hypothetical protein